MCVYIYIYIYICLLATPPLRADCIQMLPPLQADLEPLEEAPLLIQGPCALGALVLRSHRSARTQGHHTPPIISQNSPMLGILQLHANGIPVLRLPLAERGPVGIPRIQPADNILFDIALQLVAADVALPDRQPHLPQRVRVVDLEQAAGSSVGLPVAPHPEAKPLDGLLPETHDLLERAESQHGHVDLSRPKQKAGHEPDAHPHVDVALHVQTLLVNGRENDRLDGRRAPGFHRRQALPNRHEHHVEVDRGRQVLDTLALEQEPIYIYIYIYTYTYIYIYVEREIDRYMAGHRGSQKSRVPTNVFESSPCLSPRPRTQTGGDLNKAHRQHFTEPTDVLTSRASQRLVREPFTNRPSRAMALSFETPLRSPAQALTFTVCSATAP